MERLGRFDWDKLLLYHDLLMHKCSKPPSSLAGENPIRKCYSLLRFELNYITIGLKSWDINKLISKIQIPLGFLLFDKLKFTYLNILRQLWV